MGKQKMKQQQTRALYAYWNELFLEHGIPERSLIEPSSISRVLGDTFILETSDASQTRYRLAGTRLCSAFGKELKSLEFAASWQEDEKATITNILDSIAGESIVALLGSNARSESGRTIALETLVLPLLHNQQTNKRLLGITTPVHQPYWLGSDPIIEQNLTSMRIIDPSRDAEPFNTRITVLKAKPSTPQTTSIIRPTQLPNGKKVGHLVVFEGGKSAQPENAMQ